VLTRALNSTRPSEGTCSTSHVQENRRLGVALDLTYETMQLSADEGLMMFVYTAEAGSKSAEALNLLASWTATLDEPEPVPDRS
jgi:hypothetical protein